MVRKREHLKEPEIKKQLGQKMEEKLEKKMKHLLG